MKNTALLLALGAFALADSNVIEIYQNGSFIHQGFKAQKSAFSLNLPEFVSLESIDVSASCELLELNLNKAAPVKNDEYAKFKAHKKELEALTNQLLALQSKANFFNNFAISQQNISNLNADSQKIYDAVLKNQNEISTLQEKINELKENARIYEVVYEKKLDLKFECEPKFVKISYPINLQANLQNKISADTASKKVEILQNLSLKNPFATDLNDLTIAIYPFAYSSNLAPHEFYPWYEGKGHAMPLAAAPMALEKSARAKSAKMSYENEVQGETQQNTLANSWQISNVSLKASEQKTFTYDKQSLDAKFELVIDGYGSAKAYVRANFTPQKNVEFAQTHFSLDGINLGKKSVSFNAGEESGEFFGQNLLVSVKKERVGEFSKESFFGSKSKISRGFKFSVKNGSKSEWNVVLGERVPISTHEDVSVSMKNSPKEDETSKDGKVSWKFALKPNESKEVNFAYELTRPN